VSPWADREKSFSIIGMMVAIGCGRTGGAGAVRVIMGAHWARLMARLKAAGNLPEQAAGAATLGRFPIKPAIRLSTP
jgi:hypothetical protein